MASVFMLSLVLLLVTLPPARSGAADATQLATDTIAVDVSRTDGHVDLIVSGKDAAGGWREVCHSFRPDFDGHPNANPFFDTGLTPGRYQVSELLSDFRVEQPEPGVTVVCLTGSNKHVAVEERLTLRHGEPFIHVDLKAELASPALDYLMHSFVFNLPKAPAFIHSPTAKLTDERSGPGRDQVIGDHAFHAPAVILQDGPLFAALVPDLDAINRFRIVSPDGRRTQRVARNQFSVPIDDACYTMPTALDLSVTSGLTDKPVFSYGMMDFVVGHHIRFQRRNDGSMLRQLSGTSVRIAFDLFVGADVPEYLGYQRIARHHWARYGHPLFQASNLPLSFADYARRIYELISKPLPSDVQPPVAGYPDDGVFLDFELDGEPVGGLLTPLAGLGFGDALWNSEFWNNARDASGMYYWGKRLDDPTLVERARRTISLCIKAPRNEAGFFTLIYHAATKQWAASSVGPSPHPKHIFVRENVVYDIPAMSKTAAHLIEYHRQCEQDSRIVEYLKPYADTLVSLIDGRGMLPSYFTPDMQPVEDLTFSAQPAASMWFLAEYGMATGDPKYVAGARRIAVFLAREILPTQRWIDLEPYYSCGRNSLTLVADIEQGLPIRGNLSTSWAARGFAALYRETHDKQYLTAGEAVVDYLSLSQACWSPHYIYTAFPFGGFTADNIDTANWLDQRQSEMVAPMIWYGKTLGREDLVERGLAAARAAVVLVNLPEHLEPNGPEGRPLFPFAARFRPGLGPENINHEGHNQAAMRTHSGWGEGSAIFTALSDAARLTE